jgi:hypothetical protein
MDGQTLQQLFSGTNPFLAQMGEKAFNLDQQKRQADLASVVGQEQRAVQNHPLEQDVKRANIRQSDAAAGYSTSMKKKIDDDLLVLGQIPMDQRVNAHISKMKSELSEADMKRTDAEMETLLGAAAAAAQNKGTLPLGYTLQNPQHAAYFKTPQGSALAMQIARAYFMQKPKEMYAASNDARSAASAANVANIGAAAREKAKSAQARLKPPKNNLEAVYYYQEMARNAEDEVAAAQFTQLSQQAQQAYEAELIQKATLAAQSRLAGSVDTGQMGDVPTRPLPSVPQGRSSAPATKPKGDGSKDNPIVLR